MSEQLLQHLIGREDPFKGFSHLTFGDNLNSHKRDALKHI